MNPTLHSFIMLSLFFSSLTFQKLCFAFELSMHQFMISDYKFHLFSLRAGA